MTVQAADGRSDPHVSAATLIRSVTRACWLSVAHQRALAERRLVQPPSRPRVAKVVERAARRLLASSPDPLKRVAGLWPNCRRVVMVRAPQSVCVVGPCPRPHYAVLRDDRDASGTDRISFVARCLPCRGTARQTAAVTESDRRGGHHHPGPGMACDVRAREVAGRWEFPGGKVEPGETEAQALAANAPRSSAYGSR